MLSIYQYFVRSTFNISELASDVGCMAIDYRGISLLDFTWMVYNNDLTPKPFNWYRFAKTVCRNDLASFDVLLGIIGKV